MPPKKAAGKALKGKKKANAALAPKNQRLESFFTRAKTQPEIPLPSAKEPVTQPGKNATDETPIDLTETQSEAEAEGVEPHERDATEEIATSAASAPALKKLKLEVAQDRGSGGAASGTSRGSVDQSWPTYRPVTDALWESGGAPYLHLSRTLEALCGTTKRLRKTDILVNCFRSLLALSKEDLLPAIYLLTNHILPNFEEESEMGVGGKTVATAVCEAAGGDPKRLRELYRTTGDLGDAAQALKSNVRLLRQPPPLTIRSLYDALLRLTAMAGKGSANARKGIIVRLMQACRESETRFVVRTLLRNIRTGATLVSVLAALATAVVIHEAAFGPLGGGGAAAAKAGEPGESAPAAADGGSSTGVYDDKIDGGAEARGATAAGGGGNDSLGGGGSMEEEEEEEGAARRRSGSPMKTKTGAAPASEAAAAPSTPPPRDGCTVLAKRVQGRIKEAQALVRKAYDLCPDVRHIVETLLAGGLAGLEGACTMRVGTPVRPMLANSANSVLDMLKRIGGVEFVAEYKYDGQRSQVHLLEDGSVRLFSRNLDNATDRFPDVARAVAAARQPGVQSFVMDAELVACDPTQDYKILPFQTLSTRARKGVEEVNITVRVCVYAFDLMDLNGRCLLQEPLMERRRLLRASFASRRGEFEFASGIIVPAIGAEGIAAMGKGTVEAAATAAFAAAVGPQAEAAASAAAAAAPLRGVGGAAAMEEQADSDEDVLGPSGSQAGGAGSGEEASRKPAVATQKGEDGDDAAEDQEGGDGVEADYGSTAAATGAPTAEAAASLPAAPAAVSNEAEAGSGAAMTGTATETVPEAPAEELSAAAAEMDLDLDLRAEPDMAAVAATRGGPELVAAAEQVGFFMAAALRDSCEGLMAKRLQAAGSAYDPTKRTDSWCKLKKDYIATLGDSFDLVPIGAWWGNGRKAGWFSPVLMAAYDPDTGELQSLCRCMSGFSDVFYREMTAFYKERLLPAAPPHVRTGESCSLWFSPCEVWEIRGADLTVSPVHKVAADYIPALEGKGIALRFPRFERKREDKRAEEATTADEVLAMFERQSSR